MAECGFDFDRFTDDALLLVFHYLPLSDRIQLESVNRRWRSLLTKSWADVGVLVVWRNAIYEEISATGDDLEYVCNADPVALTNILKRSGGNLKAIRFMDTTCIDVDVMAALFQCRNVEELELHKVLFPEEAMDEPAQVMENLLTLPRLSTVVWNRNLAYDDHRQQSVARSTVGGVHLTTFPPLNAADAFTAMRGLRRLHLEDAPVLWGNFVFVCVQLAPTLEEFCYKISDHFLVPLRCTLMRGLQHLTNLKQLNIGGDRAKLRPLGGLVDDEFLNFISFAMPRLERVSVKGAERLSGRGIQSLMKNLPRLQYLNLNECDSVNNSALESACESRNTKDSYLTIFAMETEVDVAKLEVKIDNVTVLSDPRFIDESMIYGETAFGSEYSP